MSFHSLRNSFTASCRSTASYTATVTTIINVTTHDISGSITILKNLMAIHQIVSKASELLSLHQLIFCSINVRQ